MNDDRPPARRSPSLSLEVFGSIVDEGVKAVAVAAGIDEFTAAGVGASAGTLVKEFPDALREAWERRARRAAEADEAAERTSGYRYEALLLEALKDDRKLWLLRNAFATAQSEEDRRRVRFYGRIAAAGVLAEDRARVDAAARVFSTIAALDPADLKTLLRITASDEDQGWLAEHSPNRQAANVFSDALPELAEVMDSIVARLENLGLISSRENKSGMTWGNTTLYRPTAYARLCVDELMQGEEAEAGEHETLVTGSERPRGERS